MTTDEQIEAVDAAIPKNEKLSWKRKQKKIEKLLEELEPLEDAVLEMMARKTKLVDNISRTRIQMVAECIHPSNELVATEQDTLFCKFCERELGAVNRG